MAIKTLLIIFAVKLKIISMKKLLLSLFIAGGLGANAQTTLIDDSFETYTDFVITGFGQWLTLDLDARPTYTGGTATPTWDNAGDPQAWQIFNPTAAAVTNQASGDETRNFDPRTGQKYAASWAAVPNGAAPNNNDWLVSPPVTLGASNNVLTFWVKSLSDTYGLENYSVGVYTGSGTPASGGDFTTVLSTTDAPYGVWEEVYIELNDYANQTVRIGILNSGADHYMLMVDDFKITTTDLSAAGFFADKFAVSPNPATNVINITNNAAITLTKVTVTDINGRVVLAKELSDVTEAQLNVSELNSGVYFVNVDSVEGTAVKKFIKR